VKIIILCVVGFKKRRKELEFMSETIDYVQFALDLFDEDKVFSDKSRYFKDPIVRTRIHNWCKDIGLELYPVGPLGYDNSQSLIVFKDGYVPNNTLPIIWAGPDSECETNLSKKWQPLFTRKRKSENKKLIFNTNLELHSQSNKKNIPIEDSEQKVELHWNELIKIKKQWEKIGIKKKGLWMNNPKEERSLQIFFNNKLKKEFKEDIFEIYNDEIKALIQQIEIHQKNLLHYQLQDAKMGMLAPPLIANGILDEKDALREKGIRLKKLIENIYGEQIEFNFSTH